MVRKAIFVLLAVVAALGVAVALYARSVLSSDRVRLALEQQLTSALGRPTTIGSAGASIFPRIALTLSDVRIGATPEIQLDRVAVSTGLRGLVSRRVDDAEVAVRGGRISLPAAAAAAAAAAVGPDGASGAAAPSPPADRGGGSAAFTVASVRAIDVDDLHLVHDEGTAAIALRSSFDGRTLHVERLTAQSSRSTLEASGRFDTAAHQGTFAVTGDRADLDELLGLGVALSAAAADLAGPPAGPAGGPAARVTSKIAIRNATFGGYRLSELRTDLALDGRTVTLDGLEFDAFGGAFAGAVVVKTAGAEPTMQLRGQAKGLDVARFAEEAGRAGSITGRLSAAVALTSTGRDTASVRRSARGTLGVEITDGVIPRLDMVRAIVLAFGKPSGAPPEGSGSAFSRLGGDFDVSGHVLRSDNVAFASRDFDMHGRATFDAGTGALDSSMTVLLSKELTAQAGTDLRRYTIEDGRIVVPARITGTLADPAISLDFAAAARRALENELKRRAKDLLKDLFRRRKGGG